MYRRRTQESPQREVPAPQPAGRHVAMDRWQLWRRVWLRLHRKNHSQRRYAIASRTNSAPIPHSRARDAPPPGRYMFGRRHFSFVSTEAGSFISTVAGITQRPKMLHDVDCSNLLMGGSEQYENFSSTCWLEDHLHRFGAPLTVSVSLPPEHARVSRTTSYGYHGASSDLEATTSSGSGNLDDSYQDDCAESSDGESDGDSPSTSGDYPSVHPSVGNSNVINLHRYPYVNYDSPGTFLVEPPPYPTEPPPSYEEAIAGSSFPHFNSALSLNLNDNPDFMY